MINSNKGENMFKYGVHRMTWGPLFDPDNLRPFFEQAAQTGADLVEIRPPDPCILEDSAKIREIRQMAADNGIEMVFCFGYPLGMDMRSDDFFARQYAVKHLTAAIKSVAAVGGSELGGVLYSN